MLERQVVSDFQNDDDFIRPIPHELPSSSSTATDNNGNVDRVLFNNLVEMVPLVESLMDRRERKSFTRRATMVYTPTPSREIVPRKVSEKKSRKNNNKIVNSDNQNNCDDNLSMSTSKTLSSEKDREELTMLKERLMDLEKTMVEKDELLKSTQESLNQMKSIHSMVEELRIQASEKDSLLKSTQLQLSNAKIKLADRQAALEKLQWEANTSNKKIQELQENLDTVQDEITAYMQLFEVLAGTHSTACAEENGFPNLDFDLPHIEIIDNYELKKMEEARIAYMAALDAAREIPRGDSLLRTAEARLRLQTLAFKSSAIHPSVESHFSSVKDSV